MPISKVQVPSLTTPIDIRNGHSANVTYENEQFSAQVNTVNNPYVGLILSLYFPAVLDIESGVKEVSLTFGNGETYTTSFLILGYSYEYVVPVLIQIKSINNDVLTYDILHKGSVPSSSASIDVGIDSQDDTQLNFAAGSNAQSTIVITYPDEDIEGTSYEVYVGGNNECLVPPYSTLDIGKVLTVGEESGGTANLEWKAAEGGGSSGGLVEIFDITYNNVSGLDTSAVSQDLTMITTPDPSAITSALQKGKMPVIRITPDAAGYSRYLMPRRYYVNQDGELTIVFGSTFLTVSDSAQTIKMSTYFLAYGKYGGVYTWGKLQYHLGTIQYALAT